jgi:GNAT superfamily N-acetyltransferase
LGAEPLSPPDPEFLIREVVPSDADAIQALHNLSFERLCAADYSPAQMRAAAETFMPLDRRLLTSGGYYVTETAGRLIGSGGWSRDERVAALAHVRAVYVHPEFVRKGVGRQLVTLAEEMAKQAGCDAFAANSSLTAVAFYAALGYLPVAEETLTLKHGVAFPVVCMEKRGSEKPA